MTRSAPVAKSALVALLLLIACPSSAIAITVADGRIYWTKEADLQGRGAAIGRANLDGTDLRQRFITGLVRPGTGDIATGPLTVTGQHIYWGIGSVDSRRNRGALGRARLDGTGVQPRLIKRVHPGSIDAHAGYVYWTNVVNYSPDPRGVSIGRARLDGRSISRRFIKAGKSAGIGSGIAVDETGIYWGGGRRDSNGSIARASLDGRDLQRRFRGLQASPFAIDRAFLYYMVDSDLLEQAFTGISFTSLDPETPSGDQLIDFDRATFEPQDFTVSDGKLYWVEPAVRGTQVMAAGIEQVRLDDASEPTQRLGPITPLFLIRHSRRHDIH